MRRTALGVMTLALIAMGCHDRAPMTRIRAQPPDPARSSLLFVSLDTFRADAAGCGGDPAARTPHLDRLARTGVQFRAGVSASPLTLPSHTTLLTGLDPPAHGVRDNGTYRLADSVATVPVELAARSFATGAFIGAFPLDARFGLARGFDRYDDDLGGDGTGQRLLEAQRPGDEVVADARRWWSQRPAGSRWFAWIHLFDAHAPHEAPASLVRACADRPYTADASLADRFLGEAVAGAREVSGEVWVVVVGDHGEGLGDHGEATHGLFVYGSTMHVPAVIWPAPDHPGPREDTFRAIDLPATLFELLGLEATQAPGQGRSALAGEAAPRPVYLESLYALLHHGWAPLRGVEAGRWKYVSAPTPELYDLTADPGERRNVIAAHPEEAEELASLLERLERDTTGESAAGPAAPLDAEARSALESLGYATGRVEPGPLLPDPKSRLAFYGELEKAQRALSTDRPEAALDLLQDLAAQDPASKDVHQTMGVVYTELGRHREAVEAFRTALECPPHRNDRIARFELASAYLRLGRPAQAIPPLEQLSGDDPDNPAIWYNLGVAWDLLGQEANARRAWKRALRADPGFRAAEQALQGAADSH